MKLRKLFIVALTFVVVSLFALNFNVSANTVETSELITVQGAQIRTSGNAGIRFVAKEEYAGTNETAYGIILAFGEAEANEEFVIGGTVNGKEVLKGEVQSTKEGKFTATLYNVPEEFYEQKVTARAYVVDGDKVVYSQAVATRSLAEVALAAYEDGDRSEFVVKVYEAVQNAKTTLYYNGGEEAQFENFDAFVKELVADFQAADTSKTITKETFAAQSGTAIKNVFKQAEMINKYYWLLEFTLNTMTEMFEANGKEETYDDTYAESEEMLNRILAGDTSAVSDSNYANARTCVRQVLYALINKTNKGQTAAYNGYVKDFTVESNYAAILPNISTSEAVKLEENATLPTSLIKPYHTFAGWYDNAEYDGQAVTQHNGAKAYYAKFVPTVYTITYNLQGGSASGDLVEEFTFETPTITLPTASEMTIDGGQFLGWYTNESGTGSAVTEIAKGSAGNIVLYAVWQMDSAPTLNYGTPTYANFDAFVTDILADFEANGATGITKDTFVSATSKVIKTVFGKAEMLEKYAWLIQFAKDDLEVNWIAMGKKEKYETTYAELTAMYAGMLEKDTAAISGSYPNGRTCFRNFIQKLLCKTDQINTVGYVAYVSDFSKASNYASIMPNFVESEKVAIKEGAALPTTLYKKGYTFVGWYDNADCTGVAITNHTGLETYYAKFEPNA